MYHAGSDVLGVLVARVTGQSLEEFLRERIFEPLGMKDTGFHVPADQIDRLSTSYAHDPETGELVVCDEARRRPVEPSAGVPVGRRRAGVDRRRLPRLLPDAAEQGRAWAASGSCRGPSVELMTTDQLTPEQKAGRTPSAASSDRHGWGFGMAVVTQPPRPGRRRASSAGTAAWAPPAYADPAEGLTGILLTQSAMDSPTHRACTATSGPPPTRRSVERDPSSTLTTRRYDRSRVVPTAGNVGRLP